MTNQASTMKTIGLPAPTLTHFCDIAVSIDKPIEVGMTAFGLRRVIPITGGTVQGELGGKKFNGKILPAGADFQLIIAGGTQAHLDARYVIELDDGAMIFVQNKALRFASVENSQKIIRGEPVNPDEIYFRCQPQLETSSSNWHWLNEHQFIGTGQRQPDGVYISFYQVG